MADPRGGGNRGETAGLSHSTTTTPDPTAAVTEGQDGGTGTGGTYFAVHQEQVTRVPLSRDMRQGQGQGQLRHGDKEDEGGAECWPDPTGGTFCFEPRRRY